MNSYLSMAVGVLNKVRKPMSARQILLTAYQLRLVPAHLYGKTQHKTLQARLSEDILKNWNISAFVRTAPGRFYLRELNSRDRLNKESESEFVAPLRSEQLKKYYVACLRRQHLAEYAARYPTILPLNKVENLAVEYHKLSTIKDQADLLVLRIFVLLFKNGEILVHRTDVPSRKGRRQIYSLGVTGQVRRGDHNLFSSDKFGLTDAALRTLSIHLRLRTVELQEVLDMQSLNVSRVLLDGAGSDGALELVALAACYCDSTIDFDNPELKNWFEGWVPISQRRNDLHMFDSWSQSLYSTGVIASFASNHL